MKLQIKFNSRANERTLLQRAGYFRNVDYRSQKESYIRKLSGSFYPRFHVYIDTLTDEFLVLNLHYDARQESYSSVGVSAHSGEYDTDLVAAEARRIEQVLTALESKEDKTQEKKSFWRKLFG